MDSELSKSKPLLDSRDTSSTWVQLVSERNASTNALPIAPFAPMTSALNCPDENCGKDPVNSEAGIFQFANLSHFIFVFLNRIFVQKDDSFGNDAFVINDGAFVFKGSHL